MTKGSSSAWSLHNYSSLKSTHSSECFVSAAHLEKLQGIKEKNIGFWVTQKDCSIFYWHVTLDKLKASQNLPLTLFWYIHIMCVSCLLTEPDM